jgi:hypothetical protein
MYRTGVPNVLYVEPTVAAISTHTTPSLHSKLGLKHSSGPTVALVCGMYVGGNLSVLDLRGAPLGLRSPRIVKYELPT